MQDSLNTHNQVLISPAAADSTVHSVAIVVPEGKKGITFNNTPLNDTGTMGLIMIVFFFLAISFRHGYKYISDFSHYLFSVRKRQNAFEDHTVSETQVMIALIANTCLMSGILIYNGINLRYPEFNLSEHVFKSVSSLSMLCVAYFLIQMLLYHTLGYVFAYDKEDTRLWLDGFKSSQSLLGLFLFPIVLISLLYPFTTNALLIISILLYICSRLVFIFKGLRIFFYNFSYSLYFILYLCTVEIVPVFLMCTGAVYLSEFI